MLLSEANGFVGIDLIRIGAVLISECGLLVCGHRSFIDSQPRRTWTRTGRAIRRNDRQLTSCGEPPVYSEVHHGHHVRDDLAQGD